MCPEPRVTGTACRVPRTASVPGSDPFPGPGPGSGPGSSSLMPGAGSQARPWPRPRPVSVPASIPIPSTAQAVAYSFFKPPFKVNQNQELVTLQQQADKAAITLVCKNKNWRWLKANPTGSPTIWHQVSSVSCKKSSKILRRL